MKNEFKEGYKACLKSKGKDVWDITRTPGADWNRGYNRCFAENFANDFVDDAHARFPASNNPQRHSRRVIPVV